MERAQARPDWRCCRRCCLGCRYDRQLLAQVEAAAQEQRLRQGLVRSTVLGPQRAREALVVARDHITSLLKHMVDEVERNHATQVRAPLRLSSAGRQRLQLVWDCWLAVLLAQVAQQCQGVHPAAPSTLAATYCIMWCRPSSERLPH